MIELQSRDCNYCIALLIDKMIVPVTVFQIFNSIAELGAANLSNWSLKLTSCHSKFRSGIIIQIMNVYECNGMNIFMRWKMKCSIQRGEAELNGTFHLSPNENICSIARMRNIHYLFYITCTTIQILKQI